MPQLNTSYPKLAKITLIYLQVNHSYPQDTINCDQNVTQNVTDGQTDKQARNQTIKQSNNCQIYIRMGRLTETKLKSEL